MWNTGSLCTAGMIESSRGKSSQVSDVKMRQEKQKHATACRLVWMRKSIVFKRLEVKQSFFFTIEKSNCWRFWKGIKSPCELVGIFVINGNICVNVTIAKATVNVHLLSHSAGVYWFIQPFSVYLSSYSLSNPSCAQEPAWLLVPNLAETNRVTN